MPSETREFLEALFSGKPDEHYALLWTLPEKQSRWFALVEDAIQFVQSWSDHDLYIGVGLSAKDRGITSRCLANEVAGIVGLWADIDLKSEAHKKDALPASVEDALKLLPPQLPPTFLVKTGNGIHAWWLFQEPWVFETEDERCEAARLAQRWQTLLRLNASGHGWGFDRLSDLSRVLRIPGTQNCKDPANPKPVELIAQSMRRYSPGDLADFVEDSGIPGDEEQDRVAQAWRDKFADKQLKIDPSVVVPEDLLNRHMSADPRFKQTWLRQRDDLKDSSQSGYDMALANFCAGADLPEQLVVDMIIHHRRIHTERPRTVLDYFQRTIAKAYKSTASHKSIIPSIRQYEDRSAESPLPEADSPTTRALLCDQISAVLGVRILRIVKVTGKEPTYQMEFDSTKVEFQNVAKLVEQKSVRMAIAGAMDRMIPKLKTKDWEQLAQAMLSALTIQEGGEDTDFVGSARLHIENYLSESQFIDSVLDQPLTLRRRPAIIDGRITICSNDLQLHLNKTAAESYTIKAVVSMLAAIGAVSDRIKATQCRDQTRWILPISEFAPNDYVADGEEKHDA